MLGDSLTIPHADGNIVCTKINQDNYSSEYMFRDTESETTVRVRHTKTKPDSTGVSKDRHNIELTQRIFADGDVAEYTRKVYLVIEQLPQDTDVKLTDALADWLIASSDAKITALLNWES